MSDDEAALLAAIGAHPDEDTPRLVYADWLDEHGRPERAEFIRLQCLPDGDEAQLMREAELEERNRGRWLTDLRVPQFAEAQWAFRRGFPEALTAPIEPFLDRYKRLAALPWVRSLCLRVSENHPVADFLERDWNPGWVELELWAERHLGLARVVDSVAHSPRLRQLRVLRFTRFDFSPWVVDLLNASPHLDGLHLLGVPGDRNAPLFAPLRHRFGARLVGAADAR
ncbi:TIGR02996 domain-containing protein [Gemmata sp. JC673]|uniref:TIGR02996 domain-containing protein n=1 Tax=Gemmata algarum TaxID=2975278 RepID=A0ABU5F210_9BACT|nr:TIGR02996 domain-containing protein [Gemmata algarum]MDY3560832.1 TIGR02996 domain-containing protein [Gemmata algarum]